MNDASLEKAFHRHRLDASIKAVVNNLLGSEYVTVLSRPMAGRNFEVFVEIRPRFTGRKPSSK
jgi:iron complex outermembrane receptor protein